MKYPMHGIPPFPGPMCYMRWERTYICGSTCVIV